MENKAMSVSGLYYRYKKTSDDDIRKYLGRIKIVILENKGVGTVQGYYPLSEESIAKIMEKPRNISLSFDATETDDRPLKNLVEYKTIRYLVKSSSRFFLKPDVGEIFDQIHYSDLWDNKIKAIEFISEPVQMLPDTGDEHFILEAKLLTELINVMNINQCQIDALVNLIGEETLKEIIPDVFCLKYEPSKLYIFDTYKLHRVDNGFAWIDMTSTNCFANGIGGFEEMIKRAGNKLFIFNDFGEYIRWAYKCL